MYNRWLAVYPGGEVDYSLARRIPIGIQKVTEDFEDSFRSNNVETVKNSPVLPPDRVRKELITGVYEGGDNKYLWEQEVEEATSLMLNQVIDTYQRIAGEALSWDSIILIGGGGALLYQKLIQVLNHENVIMADENKNLHWALNSIIQE